jgi:hypothetical protein
MNSAIPAPVSSAHSAYEVIAHIVQSNPSIESVTLVTYVEGPNWRDLTQQGEHTSVGARLRGLLQDQGERILRKHSRDEISVKNLRDITLKLSDNKLLGVTSRVSLIGGGSAHIPMMDFMCAPSEGNLKMLTHLLRNLRQGRGVVLESGRSYHYYGCRLLTEQEWTVFLGKCLLMSGFTDDRYIGHQLIDGHCVLRLSSGKSKTRVPIVVVDLHE